MKYEKYLSWEDGEKYMLDNKAVHKATSMLIMSVERYAYIQEWQSSREMFLIKPGTWLYSYMVNLITLDFIIQTFPPLHRYYNRYRYMSLVQYMYIVYV